MEGDLSDEHLANVCANVVSQIVLQQIRRRRIAAILIAVLRKNARKKPYKKKKQHWIAPLFQIRSQHGFYHASLPKLHLEDIRFHNYFRMFATQLEALLSIVCPHLQKQDFIREAITPAERLALTLRYLASGDSMTSMTFQYLMGKTTVCNIVRETCSVIWNVLHPMILHPPILTKEKWIEITRDFEELRNFIYCIGAIDGKHVIIQCPNNAGSSYYNYKGAHSVVLLAICDAQYACCCNGPTNYLMRLQIHSATSSFYNVL
ncbi:hypothetical protein ALC62_06902 [Cyphomyrmex costatus]|uniref:DDE Tnp4 domain-containing protein n=1 Tax=Cyphomyrmex costatus TaxID=456900 RepID=A0A151II54_9HYME|nr:hypothetical protein ALC62_06902 [Cyphomyrmex costatus]